MPEIFKYPVGEYIMIKIRIMEHINKKESVSFGLWLMLCYCYLILQAVKIVTLTELI